MSGGAEETDVNILAIAHAAIAEFGSNAPEIIDKRANDHAYAGEIESYKLWHRVANAVREILKDSIP